MKKVILISASPRKSGNSDLLCDEFSKGALEAGHQVEKVNIHDLKLNYCMACYGCRQTKKCVHHDGMNDLLEKLVQADVIVLATPVYFYSLDGQMKTFIDRCLPRYREIKNKDFYYIVTAADTSHANMQSTIDSLRGFLDCLPGAKEKGIIYGTGAYQKGEILQLPVVKEAYQYGKNI